MADSLVLIQGTRLRATLVDLCGAPLGGAKSTVVSKGFISVAMTDNVEAPEEFKQKNAGGEFEINQRDRPQLNWLEVKITLATVAPELLNMLTGSTLVYDDTLGTPQAVGVGTDEDTYASASFALEVWTNIGRSKAEACIGGQARYGYLLLPWLVEGVIGDITIENGPVSFDVTAITSGGNDWGIGPYNVIKTRTGVSSRLLAPLPTLRHRQLMFTTLAPPAAVNGFQSLVVPS